MAFATHSAVVRWERDPSAAFTDRRYSRAHRWTFDGGLSVPGSSSPHVVPLPFSDPAAIDPEEAFVAALSSCHMLWFLDLAARAGFVVDSYDDPAEGHMGKSAAGKLVVERVDLRPRTRFSGARVPSREELARLHHQAHDECFLANSVRCEIRCEPRWD